MLTSHRTEAGTINPTNKNLTWGQLALINAEKIMAVADRFAAEGNQNMENLAHLKEDQIVGQWRDSTYGIQKPYSHRAAEAMKPY